METYIKCLEEVVLATGLLHSIPAEPNFSCQKIPVTTLPLTSGCLSLQIAIPLIIICEAWLSERPIKLCNIKDELKAKIMTAFTNLNRDHQKGLQEILKLSGKLWLKPMAISLNKFSL